MNGKDQIDNFENHEYKIIVYSNSLQVLFDIEGVLRTGTVSEVYDGDPPHTAGGAFSQAWNIAELLRIKDIYGWSRHDPPGYRG